MPKYSDSGFSPPAPVAQVTLRRPDGSAQLEGVLMLIDTGADVWVVPRSAIQALGGIGIDDSEIRLVGFGGGTSTCATARLEVILAGRSFRGRFVVIDQELGILGRNVLNSLCLLFDGPRLSWEVVPAPA